MLLAACAPSRERRINKSSYNTWPVEIQQKVKDGRIDKGMTTEMVEVALGKPDRKRTESSANGQVEVWAWTESKPGVGLSVGMATGSRYGVGTGVSVGTGGGGRTTDRQTVTFQDGIVIAYSLAAP